MGVTSLYYSGKLVLRFGAKNTLIAGLTLMCVGLAIFTQAPVDGDFVRNVLPAMIPLGLGGGITFPALMALAMSGATPEDAGLASGLINTMVQVGGALGLAVLATLAATRTNTLTADGHSLNSALTGGYHLAFFVSTGLLIAAIIVAATVIKPTAPVMHEAPVEVADGDLEPDREPANV
jgi:MFS family permease